MVKLPAFSSLRTDTLVAPPIALDLYVNRYTECVRVTASCNLGCGRTSDQHLGVVLMTDIFRAARGGKVRNAQSVSPIPYCHSQRLDTPRATLPAGRSLA